MVTVGLRPRGYRVRWRETMIEIEPAEPIQRGLAVLAADIAAETERPRFARHRRSLAHFYLNAQLRTEITITRLCEIMQELKISHGATEPEDESNGFGPPCCAHFA